MFNRKPRGRRLVRLHLHDDFGASFEGILLGCWDGHYYLLQAKMLTEEEVAVVVGDIQVQTQKVIFLQSLAESG